jgi:hypothetical protein
MLQLIIYLCSYAELRLLQLIGVLEASVTIRDKRTKLLSFERIPGKCKRGGLLLVGGFICVLSFGGCAVFQAGGDTIEAIGEGATTAFVGLASGTGHAIAGTGRAISSAAGSTSQSVDDYAQLATEPKEDRRQPVY